MKRKAHHQSFMPTNVQQHGEIHPIATSIMFAIADTQLSTFCSTGRRTPPTVILPMYIRKRHTGFSPSQLSRRGLVGMGNGNAVDKPGGTEEFLPPPNHSTPQAQHHYHSQ